MQRGGDLRKFDDEEDPEKQRRASLLRRRRSSLLRRNSVLGNDDMFLKIYRDYLGLKCGLQTQELAAIVINMMVKAQHQQSQQELQSKKLQSALFRSSVASDGNGNGRSSG